MPPDYCIIFQEIMFDIRTIWSFLKKNFNRFDLLIGLALVILFFVTRLINLEKLPIFCDEGIYIRWAKVAWHDASWRFISLTDGRQPVQTWATIPFLKLFPARALFAGRLFGVASGFASLVGLFSLLRYLFNKKTAFVGSLLYVITPFFLFYDRMALADSAVNAGFIWILFFSILMVKNLRLDTALIFGLISGLVLLTKSTARIFLGLSLLAPIVNLFKNKKRFVLDSLNYFVLMGIVGALAFVFYNIQRLSPFMHYIAEKNTTFVMTFSEFLKNPFAVFWHNLQIIPYYVFSELGYLVAILGVIGLFTLFKKDRGLALYLLSWLVLSFLAIAFFSKVIFPRYLIFLATLLLIAASFFVGQLKPSRSKLILVVLLVVSLYYGWIILFNPPRLPFPEIDRGQYIEGECAGYGAKEIMEFARIKSQEKQVVLLAEGDFGLIADMLNVHLLPGDKIDVRGFWPLEEKQLLENQKEIGQNYVYAVFSQRKTFPGEWPIKLIMKYDKPVGRTAYYLFELLPKEQ